MTEKEIRDLFASKGIPLGQKDVWQVQGKNVIKHAALEWLAGVFDVQWSPAQVLRAERDEAVILVTGSVPGVTAWSIGEALVGVNYRVTGKQAAYVYAMAEKRAKDRVILKLAQLHGAYSEDEADEFKEARPSEEVPETKVPAKRTDTPSPPPSQRTIANALMMSLKSARNEYDLGRWLQDNQDVIDALPDALKEEVRNAYREKLATLRRAA
jgi:hypothetical protein